MSAQTAAAIVRRQSGVDARAHVALGVIRAQVELLDITGLTPAQADLVAAIRAAINAVHAEGCERLTTEESTDV